MTTTVSTVQLGVSGVTPVTVSTSPNDFVASGVSSILLSADYVRSPVPHWPVTPPGCAPASLANAATAHTFASGATVSLYAAEAAAIVAAGGGTLV